MDNKTWWKERMVYQVYPRSFQDSNGDGIGDLPGIISRLDDIKALGAGIIWLSPVYASPDADNGYDISDYRAINPKLGTMADMDELLRQAEQRDIKIVMDLVINHTSDEHDWFQQSRDPNSKYRDYYIWRPGKAEGKPPNNWGSFFMEDAWEYDAQSGEYYLHLFDKKQPDLNYHNPQVIEEVKDILRFWLDKGVAGFRCDVINIIYKESFADGRLSGPIRGMEHYKCKQGNHDILQQLRRDVFDKYDCFTVGETVMVDVDEAKLLCDPQRGELDMLFYFEHLEVDRRISRYVPKRFRARKLLDVLAKWQKGLHWNAVYLENHDQPRIVSHYGTEGEYWARSAKLLATLQFTLRGTPFVYQGQEIGMTNFDFTSLQQLQDVESFNIDKLMRRLKLPARVRWNWLSMSSRDNARTPMQWSDEEGASFTTGTPWLGINGNHTRINYAQQQQDPDSVLNYYRRMAALRADSEILKYGSFQPLYSTDSIIAYARELDGERYIIVMNMSKQTDTAPFTGKVIAGNTERQAFEGILQPYEALVLAEVGE